MTNLTEKWRKGELPYAEYYIKLAGGENTNDVWDIDGWQSFNKKGDVVVEVLAEVPSYEQWIMTKNLSERAHLEMYKARGEKVRLEKENTELKETISNDIFLIKSRDSEIVKLKKLLKECRFLLGKTPCENTSQYLTFSDVLNRVDQVLKENEL